MKFLFLFLMITLPPASDVEFPSISPVEAKKHVGEKVKVCGKVVDAKFVEGSARQTTISMGGGFPNQPLTVIINNEDRKNFSYKPEEYLKNKSVCINGKVVENNGRTELFITREQDITIDDEEDEFEMKRNFFDFFNKYFDDK